MGAQLLNKGTDMNPIIELLTLDERAKALAICADINRQCDEILATIAQLRGESTLSDSPLVIEESNQ